MLKEKVKYAFYTMGHPADGFYEIRHRGQGSVPLAILLVILFSICYSANRQYAGFVVNYVNPMNVNSGLELVSIFLLFFLFCAGNWSITCLMNGEGRFKDIVTVTGYAMLPLVLTYIPAILLSQFVAADEQAFYYLILAVGIFWFLMMALVGIMTVHNYTLGKTLITILFTFVAMFIIIFVALLLFSLIGQVVSFAESIYNEILLRV